MTQFSELVEQMNLKEKDKSMTKKTKGGSKNPAIKSGNPAFKATKNVGTKVTGGKGKLNAAVWRGTPRGK